MSDLVQQMLNTINEMPVNERDQLVIEILHRYPVSEGELSDAGLVVIADELFQSYDAAESGAAAPSS